MRKNNSSRTVATRRTPGGGPRKKRGRVVAVDGYLSRTKQRKLVDDSRLLYMSLWPHQEPTGACVFHAVALQLLGAKRHDLNLMLQAGSAWWPRLDKWTLSPDAGGALFGYEFAPGKTAHGLKDGELVEVLPEIHAWLGIRHEDRSGTIVDPTTGTWPAASMERHGVDWPGRKPPPFLWEHTSRLDEKWPPPFAPSYHPSAEAADVVTSFAIREIYPRVGEAVGVDWKLVAFA